jgi:hypothetical protein
MRPLMINLFLLIPVFLSAQVQDSFYFFPPPEEWNLIGEATFEDFQQCFGFGDFDGDSQSELVGNYSHSAIGLFIHDFNGRELVRSAKKSR